MQKKKLEILVEELERNNGEKIVIVKKVSFFAKLLEVLSDSLYKGVRILFWIIICILITVGFNTLLNGELRQQVINIFYQMMGGV